MSEKPKSTHHWQSRLHLLLLPVVIACSSLLVSCGGGSDSASTTESADGTKEALAVSGSSTVPGSWTGRAPKMEVINGITVPPEPAPALNNATVAGVDVNNNGVRDDVERIIARKSQTTPAFEAGLGTARELSKLISRPRPTQGEMDAISRNLNCQGLKLANSGISDNSYIASALLNTPERQSAYRKNSVGYVGGLFSPSYNDCQVN